MFSVSFRPRNISLKVWGCHVCASWAWRYCCNHPLTRWWPSWLSAHSGASGIANKLQAWLSSTGHEESLRVGHRQHVAEPAAQDENKIWICSKWLCRQSVPSFCSASKVVSPVLLNRSNTGSRLIIGRWCSGKLCHLIAGANIGTNRDALSYPTQVNVITKTVSNQ